MYENSIIESMSNRMQVKVQVRGNGGSGKGSPTNQMEMREVWKSRKYNYKERAECRRRETDNVDRNAKKAAADGDRNEKAA